MIDKAYIQRSGGEWINETAFAMMRGCRQLGIPIEPFEAPDLPHAQTRALTPQTLVHGYVSVVHEALRRLGRAIPDVDGAPPRDIERFYGRHMWVTTLGWVRSTVWAQNRRVFIKPLKTAKAFTGFVTTGRLQDFQETSALPDDFEVLCADPVCFVTEYRLFIHRQTIIDCRHYRGDYRRMIDFNVATACVEAYKSAPVAYALDLGLTDDERTVVVDVNDAYALGCYGMASVPYAQMMVDRWEQLMETAETTPETPETAETATVTEGS